MHVNSLTSSAVYWWLPACKIGCLLEDVCMLQDGRLIKGFANDLETKRELHTILL